MKVTPAILPASRADLEIKLQELQGKVVRVHIDVVDGVLASPACWPYSEGSLATVASKSSLLPMADQFQFEIDIMATNAIEVIDAYVEAGASRFIVHPEHADDIAPLLEHCKENHGYDKAFSTELFSIGIALHQKKDLTPYLAFADQIDFFQVMGIAHIGVQGQPFEENTFDMVSAIRKEHRHIPIQVDGGVSLATAERLVDKGVTTLVVGSALWRSKNITEELASFNKVFDEHGIYQ
jgi:ribulose-phosphate 3-epimerase